MPFFLRCIKAKYLLDFGVYNQLLWIKCMQDGCLPIKFSCIFHNFEEQFGMFQNNTLQSMHDCSFVIYKKYVKNPGRFIKIFIALFFPGHTYQLFHITCHPTADPVLQMRGKFCLNYKLREISNESSLKEYLSYLWYLHFCSVLCCLRKTKI